MSRKISIIVSGILAGLTTGAHAADAIVTEAPEPIVVTPFNWGGAYIGGQVGYGWGSSRFSAEPDFSIARLRSNGFLGGLYAGYNFDTGTNLVLGIDGDFTGTAIDRTLTDDLEGSRLTARTQLRWSGATRVRLGYAVDRFLPYIAGGVAFGSIKDTINTGNIAISQQRTQTGWTAGGGVDYAVTDNVVLRLEYRYTDFGKRNFNFGLPDIDADKKLTTHDIRLGIAYKF